MFKAKIKSYYLKDFINIVSNVADEIKLNIQNNGWSVKVVDPAHVALLDVMLDKDAFVEYETDGMEIGIDVERFKKVAGSLKKDSDVDIEFRPKTNKLNIKNGNLTRRLTLLDTTNIADIKLPNIDFTGTAVLGIDEFKQGVTAASSISDVLTIEMTKDSFRITSNDDLEEIDLTVSDKTLFGLSVNGSCKTMYSTVYLSNFLKTVKTDVLTLKTGKDIPLMFELKTLNGFCNVNYLLAPRIESE